MITRKHTYLTTVTGATFSDCERYRYRLWRTWADQGPLINFLMLNPSTADELANDPTVERCQRRATQMGYAGLIVTNLFAIRATDPKVMLADPAPIGPDNDDAILEAADCCDLVVCAWGNHGSHMGRSESVLTMLRSVLPAEWLTALKVSKTGQPCHPLYLPYHLIPSPFTAAEKAAVQ